MKTGLLTARERDAAMEHLVAELTEAAYHVALKHGVGNNWLDLQLDLRAALSQALATRV